MSTEQQATITPELLLQSGYQCHPAATRTLYQKAIKDGEVNLYFIDIYYRPRNDPTLHPSYDWDISVRLYRDDAMISINYAFDLCLSKIEGFFALAYSALHCIPDPHNND